MLIIVKEITNEILACNLENGQVAVIIEWDGRQDVKGKVVQRYKDSLVILGAPKGSSWSMFFQSKINNPSYEERFRVRILAPGTILKIVD